MPIPDPDPHRVAEQLRAALPDLEALAAIDPRAEEILAGVRNVIADLEALAAKRQAGT